MQEVLIRRPEGLKISIERRPEKPKRRGQNDHGINGHG